MPVAEAVFLHQIVALARKFQAGALKSDGRGAGTDRFIAVSAGQTLTTTSGAGSAGGCTRRYKGKSIGPEVRVIRYICAGGGAVDPEEHAACNIRPPGIVHVP